MDATGSTCNWSGRKTCSETNHLYFKFKCVLVDKVSLIYIGKYRSKSIVKKMSVPQSGIMIGCDWMNIVHVNSFHGFSPP